MGVIADLQAENETLKRRIKALKKARKKRVKSLRVLSAVTGIPKSTLWYRKSRGYPPSLVVAKTLKPDCLFFFDGAERTLSGIARATGLTRSKLQYWTDQGMTIDEIIDEFGGGNEHIKTNDHVQRADEISSGLGQNHR